MFGNVESVDGSKQALLIIEINIMEEEYLSR